ncbi:ADP-ribose pyrophosphatase YjhB (NUDIX family) [Scopulibacillus daqui]|uniref:ADP-ribose pyrophosphatase YjhB (NUDIX family) n=1 Tax=Scopulibacillus daqui TaxID=1469162 RepID=A0ABS2Q0H2_9BACL|nr:NUDIX domain-containing protein [Scopulibacillus daqui]MBM7645460.1 ADP-ribose pyrophosphatase YjhB (NUDIX family) [Scopulibacillus daqui]
MANQDALKQYNPSKYKTPDGYTSDIAVFTITSQTANYKPPKMTLKLMLIKRSKTDSECNPNIEANKWALPGGFVQPNETAFEAAKRELEEETGVRHVHLKHFGVYDTPGRDPRGWIISNAHYAVVPEHFLADRKANDDAAEVELFSLNDIKQMDLAFDHKMIVSDAFKMIKNDLLQTTAAKNFLPELFTYSELQAVLLTVSNDPAISSDQAFARKIKTLPFLEEAKGQTTTRTSKKPTQLYRFIDMDIVKPIYTARY